MKRHTCIICKKKRYENYMVNVFNHSWACKKSDLPFPVNPCYCHSDIYKAKQIIELSKDLKILNLKHLTK